MDILSPKILSNEKLKTLFLLAEIKDTSIKKIFSKNPNIMVLNNKILDFEY